MKGSKGSNGPVRKCIGCSIRKEKKLLVRLVLKENGKVHWDKEKTAPGRGAYLCPSEECLATAIKKKRFQRAFRGTGWVNLDEISKVPWIEN